MEKFFHSINNRSYMGTSKDGRISIEDYRKDSSKAGLRVYLVQFVGNKCMSLEFGRDQIKELQEKLAEWLDKTA